MSSIRELGERLKCQKCDKFGKVIKLSLNPAKKHVQMRLACAQCGREWREDLSIEEFEKLANGFLIDTDWVKNYQRKVLFHFQKFVKLPGGLEGSYSIKNPELLKRVGKELFLCPCGELYQWKLGTFIFKKKVAYAEILLHCSCGKDAKKLVEIPNARELFITGLVDAEFIKNFEEQLSYELEGFDTKEGYGLTASILAPHAQEALGMVSDDGSADKKCPYCGTSISKFAGKCPSCGNDLEE
jgi:hypothetical protein